MAENSKEKNLYRQYAAKVGDVLKDKDAHRIFESLQNGKNTYMRIDRIESSSFDLSWINMIEDCIPDLGTIVNNPRLSTKTVSDLVPVELARKTNADSVKHLASHTQFIKEIQDDGNVIPNKVLNIGSDDEIKTYENRFIATLIRHLVLFIEKRYEYVKRFAVLHNHEILFFKNSSEVNGADVNIETKVTVVSPKTDPVSLANNEYVLRIEQMREFVLYYYNSKFMRQFRNERDVRNPILQTNIIRKNPLYHHCYELYRFIEAYDRLGVNYKVDESFSEFDRQELYELNCLVFANYLALQGKDKSIHVKAKVKTYKPKILTSSDDEAFVYGPLFKGPIEFVRVDEAYQRYLDSFVNKDVPEHPDSHERAYYSDDIQAGKWNKIQYEEKLKLLERKKWQKIQFDKEVQARIKEREEEEERLRKARIEARLKEEEEYLRVFRQRIVDEALRFKPKDQPDEVEPIYEANAENVYKPTSLTSQRPFDFDKMSDIDKELFLQQLKLNHAAEKGAPKVQEAKEKPASGVALSSKPAIKEETPSLPEVVPVMPVSKEDVLTAGLGQENAVPSLPVVDDEMTEKSSVSIEPKEDASIPPVSVKTEVVEVEKPLDYDSPDRLTDEEKKAVLVYGLESRDEALNHLEGKINNLPEVPFPVDDDGYHYDPFERIRALNHAYKEYDEEYGPFIYYPGLVENRLLKDLPIREEMKKQVPPVMEEVKVDNLLDGLDKVYVVFHKEYGYYVDEKKFSMDRNAARIFLDFDEANRMAISIHGKVITL